MSKLILAFAHSGVGWHHVFSLTAALLSRYSDDALHPTSLGVGSSTFAHILAHVAPITTQSLILSLLLFLLFREVISVSGMDSSEHLSVRPMLPTVEDPCCFQKSPRKFLFPLTVPISVHASTILAICSFDFTS
jgi:hypothetical protein